MWKIIKQNEENLKIKRLDKLLSMKWQFMIEFINDNFGPYEYKFWKFDCYYDDWLEDRWSSIFPYKNKEFNNTEIFLETDDVIVCSGDRTNLSGIEKTFIDIINIKTEQKQRLFVEEVNLIYNWDFEIIINANFSWVWKTVILDEKTMEIKEEKEEKLLAFFKVIYNENEEKWYRLDFDWEKYSLEWIEKLGELKISEFDRKNFRLNKRNVWWFSCEKIDVRNLNFFNNQKYVMSEQLSRSLILSKAYSYITPRLNLFYFFLLTSSIYVIEKSLIVWLLFIISISIIIYFFTIRALNKYLNTKLVFRKNFLDDTNEDNFFIIKKSDLKNEQKIKV